MHYFDTANAVDRQSHSTPGLYPSIHFLVIAEVAEDGHFVGLDRDETTSISQVILDAVRDPAFAMIGDPVVSESLPTVDRGVSDDGLGLLGDLLRPSTAVVVELKLLLEIVDRGDPC